ncbi:hypothetical protein ANME2D_02483 [Candidatus Methanoperedens nitroreducens]|uniref:HIT domain-containing protein n=2 Tax=Candidatus Methanoperedens nitratireducens TaxID=1392998 RepID=A0A062UW92_9EURY|nr:hypothetical protein ANME2D_02483 [Candidatus Methanoperedens nitroreducens]
MNFHRKLDSKCDFCIELEDFSFSRFSKIYGNTQRIIFSNEYFNVMPTIGQLFLGSLLILPKEHYYSFAEIPEKRIEELNKIIKHLENKLVRFGKTVLFEHGTSPEIGGGCGIYHAHIHLVPVPSAIPPEFLLGKDITSLQNLESALLLGKQRKEYLLYRHVNNMFFIASPTSKLQSQHFRKKLVEFFDLKSPWDWREYGYEKKLIETIDYFRKNRVVLPRNFEIKEDRD